MKKLTLKGSINLENDQQIFVAMIVVFIVGAAIIGIFRIPHKHDMDVRQIRWECGVHIEEYQKEHHRERSTYPKDAYNVESYEVRKSKRVKDSDGDYHTRYYYVTRYDYDVNVWKETRCVVTWGNDHNPYFGEYTLKEAGPDGLGEERVSYNSTVYTASGVWLESKRGICILSRSPLRFGISSQPMMSLCTKNAHWAVPQISRLPSDMMINRQPNTRVVFFIQKMLL